MLREHHSKGLMLHMDELMLDLATANPEIVVTKNTFKRSRSEFDIHINRSCLKCAWSFMVVELIFATERIDASALGGKHPLVGRTGIEDGSHLLRRISKADSANVVEVFVVFQ